MPVSPPVAHSSKPDVLLTAVTRGALGDFSGFAPVASCAWDPPQSLLHPLARAGRWQTAGRMSEGWLPAFVILM